MGISIGDFAKARKDMVYETDAGNLTLSYSPNALTPSDEAKLMAAREQSSIALYKEMLEMVCKLVKSWDLNGPLYNSETGDEIVPEGEPVPISPDILQHLPLPFLTGLYRAIGEDNIPKSSNVDQKKITKLTSPNASGSIYQGSFD
jgi:hypothetical protein